MRNGRIRKRKRRSRRKKRRSAAVFTSIVAR